MSIRWSPYVAPKFPKGASKKQNGRFLFKNALRLKKVCYKVSLCENCQRQSCKAFIGLTNCAKIIGGGRPLVPEILDQSDRKILSPSSSVLLLAKTITHPAARSLCDSWASCNIFMLAQLTATSSNKNNKIPSKQYCRFLVTCVKLSAYSSATLTTVIS